jgi:hypothetical protein
VTRARGGPETAEAGRLRRTAARTADLARLAMRGLLRPLAGRGRFAAADRRRRLVLVQVDGVSRGLLERALAGGWMPALAARVASGRHVLARSRSGAPASTPAFQAGLFYGVAPSVPGFVWFDRATRREVRMDRPEDAARVERRLAARTPGLLRGGAAYFSIFSGGAAAPHFCLSGLAGDLALDRHARRLGAWDAVASTLAHSVTAARSAVHLAHDVGHGVVDGLRWSLALGRATHEARFLLHRVVVGAFLRQLAVQGILVDLSRGVPVIYVDFLAFDETAHRRGPGSRAALRCLSAVDEALAAILAATDAVPELGYEVHVLSDHGHVRTRPFESLEGSPLPDFVARAEHGRTPPPRPSGGVGRGVLWGRAGARRADGLAVAEAGDLAHVYFLDDAGPLPLEALRARHGPVLDALARSPAIGLLGVRGGARGFALVRGRAVDLADPRQVARLPHPDPVLAGVYLSSLLSLPDAGDLVVQGWRGDGQDCVAYAWEFGSHGGLAPEELDSFVAHPAASPPPSPGIPGPVELHRWYEALRAEGDGPGAGDGAARPWPAPAARGQGGR